MTLVLVTKSELEEALEKERDSFETEKKREQVAVRQQPALFSALHREMNELLDNFFHGVPSGDATAGVFSPS